MSTTPQPPLPGCDLPAVPRDDYAPAWDKEVAGSNAAVLQQFKEWVHEEGLPPTSDAHLVKFVHSCDYDLEKAKKCAKDFHWSRKEAPEFFSDWDIDSPSLQAALDVVMVVLVPRITPTNCRVLINSLKTSDTSKYVVKDVCKLSLMIIESIFLTEPTIDGLIIIHDLEKITFSHVYKMLWSMNRKIQSYFEDGVPIKRDNMFLVNCPGLVDKGLRLMRNIGRKEDWDKVRVCKGDDFDELYDFVPRECLPSELGGTLPPLDELQAMTVHRLREFKDIFRNSLSGSMR